jgi:hypothetical protein
MLISIAAGNELDTRGSIRGRVKRCLSSSDRSDRFRPIQPPMSIEDCFFANKAIIHLHLVVKSRLVVLYLHSPIRL